MQGVRCPSFAVGVRPNVLMPEARAGPRHGARERLKKRFSCAFLKHFATNLNSWRGRTLPPVFGREREINKCSKSSATRARQLVMLISEPGVGRRQSPKPAADQFEPETVPVRPRLPGGQLNELDGRAVRAGCSRTAFRT